MDTIGIRMPRLNRVERQELTTSQLLETAKAVFLERGYHRSTLDDIAEAAGFTKGAVYARFASKDDLFLALFDAWTDMRIAEIRNGVAERQGFEEYVASSARRMMALRREQANWYLVLLEFWTYAARDNRLRAEFAVRHNRLLQEVAASLERSAAAVGLTLVLPALDLARAGSAMGHGVTLERLSDPERVPDTLLEAMLKSFVRATALAAPAKQERARHRKRRRSR